MLAGEACERLRDIPGAEKELRTAMQVNAKQPNVHFALGYLLWTEDKWADAADEFQRELENDLGHANARVYLSDSRVRLHQFAEALPDLEALAAGKASGPLVHSDLGLIYMDAGRNQDAIRELKAAIEAGPDNPEPHLALSKLYDSMGEKLKASTELAAFRRLPAPGHPSLQRMIDSIENPVP
jgi:Flp pilus assembly protein TadD